MNSGGESLPLLPEKRADEGYVKYVCLHENAPAPDVPALKELDALRTELFDAGLIGMRQDGIGYGNISLRTEKGFVISATATGGIRELGADGYSLVTEWSLAGNRLSCSGPLPASSEALTHAAVYEAGRDAKCVIHVHSRPLFDGFAGSRGPVYPSFRKLRNTGNGAGCCRYRKGAAAGSRRRHAGT